MKATLEHTCNDLLRKYHHNCLFKNILKDGNCLAFTFDNNGTLKGRFFCHEKYQGYDNRVHGGIIAAVIDESMVHCLMGHDIVGVTTELHIKYRLPIFINQHIDIITQITESLLDGMIYNLTTEVLQDKKNVITATARFFTTVTNMPGY